MLVLWSVQGIAVVALLILAGIVPVLTRSNSVDFAELPGLIIKTARGAPPQALHNTNITFACNRSKGPKRRAFTPPTPRSKGTVSKTAKVPAMEILETREPSGAPHLRLNYIVIQISQTGGEKVALFMRKGCAKYGANKSR
jgi:hypothetical protein